MLNLKLRVGSAEEAEARLPKLLSDIGLSAIPEPDKAYLLDAVRTTMTTWQAQMFLQHAQSMRAERNFEGNGYRIVLTASPANRGFVAKIARLLRRA